MSAPDLYIAAVVTMMFVGGNVLVAHTGQPEDLFGFCYHGRSCVRVGASVKSSQVLVGGWLRRHNLSFQSNPAHRIFFRDPGGVASNVGGSIRCVTAIVEDEPQDDHCVDHRC